MVENILSIWYDSSWLVAYPERNSELIVLQHGHSFMILGTGQGEYDREKDEAKFNYHNPTRRDVAILPRKGWIAIR